MNYYRERLDIKQEEERQGFEDGALPEGGYSRKFWIGVCHEGS